MCISMPFAHLDIFPILLCKMTQVLSGFMAIVGEKPFTSQAKVNSHFLFSAKMYSTVTAEKLVL